MGSGLAFHSSLSTTARDLCLAKAENEREAVSLKRGKPKKVKLIDSPAVVPPDFSGRRVSERRGFASSSNNLRRNRFEKRDRFCFWPLLPRQSLVRRLVAIERKERCNEYYIAVRKLLTDDVVAATLLARSSRSKSRGFSPLSRHCYLVVTPGMWCGRWMGDVTKNKIVHEGL